MVYSEAYFFWYKQEGKNCKEDYRLTATTQLSMLPFFFPKEQRHRRDV